MTKSIIYLDLSELTAEELKLIPQIGDEFSLRILSQYRKLFEQGTYNEKMPFLFYNSEFRMFACTFVRHHSKTEITFPELRDVLSDKFANEMAEANTTQEKADAIIKLLDSYDLSADKKLEILSTTRKRLENFTSKSH